MMMRGLILLYGEMSQGHDKLYPLRIANTEMNMNKMTSAFLYFSSISSIVCGVSWTQLHYNELWTSSYDEEDITTVQPFTRPARGH